MKIKSPIKKEGAQKSWIHQGGDRYEVTGRDREGKPFCLFFKDWRQAQGINVWRGTKWLVRNGHRYVIQRIVN